ncbi:hypothetical protein [Streptomyces cavernae]|uniref:hypothetical protein n=1 Tax=Streptomyces cavernae TaxID=2259034 RepID=UPI000FEC01F9|nr:hypothetical protein [Streptomyces cavernae]
MKARTIIAAKPQLKRFIARTVGAAAVGALAWTALATGAPGGTGGSGGSAGSDGSRSGAGAAAVVADDAPGYAVENFDYPGADKILAEQSIVLKRGDGHITLADCASGTGLIQIMARKQSETVCFRVVGNSGWLTMEIPAVYAVKGNDYETQVDMTVGTEEKSFDIDKNTWTAVGESADEQGREHMLVEIRTSK